MASIQKLENGKFRAFVEKLKVRDSRVFASKRAAEEIAAIARLEKRLPTQRVVWV
jgi:hypothetical protein